MPSIRYRRRKFHIIQDITKEVALNLEAEELQEEDSDIVLTSKTATDDSLLEYISMCSQNSLCFYPDKLYYDEGLKRNLNIEDLVSSLPLLSEGVLIVPKGVELDINGKYYDEMKIFRSSSNYTEHVINVDKKLKLCYGFKSKKNYLLNFDFLSLSDLEIIDKISQSSLNEISFYPGRFYLDEALKRNLDVKDIVADLPILTESQLWIPEGVDLWSDGKIYREIWV